MNVEQIRSVYSRGVQHPIQIRRYTDPAVRQLLLTEDVDLGSSSVVLTEDANHYLATDSNDAMLLEAAAAYILTEDNSHYLELSLAPYHDYPAAAKLIGLGAQPLTEAVAQYAMRAIVLVEPLITAGFIFPITTNDKLLWSGREWAIEVPDGATRYWGATLIAYQLMLRG